MSFLTNSKYPCKKVPDSRRMSFHPRLARGNLISVLTFEPTLFATFEKYDPSYSGGYWEYYIAKNGAHFQLPEESSEKIEVTNPENYYSGTMSREALALAVMMMQCSLFSFKDEKANYGENYHLLYDLIDQHPENGEIRRFLD